MKKIKIETFPLIGILIPVVLYFRKFFFNDLVPFPGNLLASFYAPWSGEKWPGFPVGVPRLDLLGVDTVRQDFPWKSLLADALKDNILPLWNPYSFSGNPQLAAFQTGVFYPLNVFFLFLSKIDAWTIITLLQPILAFIFTYLFTRNLKIGKLGSFFAGIAFAFSPLLTAWLPWLMTPHAMIWLPLALYAVDKTVEKCRKKDIIILTFSLVFSLFAGHPQIAIYVFIASIFYFTYRLWNKRSQIENVRGRLIAFFVSVVLFLGITSVQWLPTAEFYSQALRESNSSEFKIDSAYLYPQKIATFFAPDFFGNPVTENYWGKGNYIENMIYPGITVLILAGLAMLTFRTKTTIFFFFMAVISLLFSFQTPISKTMVLLKIPIFSSSVPTRILFLMTFSVSVLAGVGLDIWIKQRLPKKRILIFLVSLSTVYFFLWGYGFFSHNLVSIRNLMLPTVVFLLSGGIVFTGIIKDKLKKAFIPILVTLFIIDTFYLANKITYFSHRQFTFPSHPIIEFLQNNAGINRFYGEGSAKIDSNFGIVYNLQQAEGYDALYISRYGELITAANNGGKIVKDIPRSTADLPSEKNKYRERLFSLLGIKYIIDKNDLYQKEWEPEYDKFPQDSYNLVWQKGKWKIYENKKSLPRIFLADKISVEQDKQKIVDKIFDPNFNLGKTVIVEKQPPLELTSATSTPEANLISYGLNKVLIKTKSDNNNVLLLSDNFYPGWKSYIDGVSTEIYRANYSFRAVFVPKGQHEVIFSFEPDTVKLGSRISLLSIMGAGIILIVSRKKRINLTT